MIKHGNADHLIRLKGFKIGDFMASKVSDLNLLLLFLLISSAFIFIPGTRGSIVRAALGFAFVLFVPGYALTAALFPRKGAVGNYERVVLAVAASICIAPLLGLLFNYTRWGIRMEPVMIGLILLTALCLVIASLRRRLQKPGERFSPEIVKSCKGALTLIFPSDTRTNRALTAALILAIAGASLTIAYAVFVPDQSGQFTELYVLGPDHTLANQSRYFFVGEPQPIIVGVVNHERRDVPYTLVVSLDDGASRSTMHTQDIRLGHNETWENVISLATDRAGEGMKMTFALYKDGDMSAPYRDVYIRVDSETIGEKFTGFDVLGNNNTTLEATRFTLGGGKYFNVTVFNHEYRTVPYTIKVILIDAANTTTLYADDISLAHNETSFKRIKVIPDRTGVNMDMRFLLYRDNDLTAAYAMKSLPATVRSPPPAPADSAAANATAPADSGYRNGSEPYARYTALLSSGHRNG